ncbi:MAG: DegT/DnrJ/EryC1/StrS family aminotransferase, partial [Candidatus Brockarchaeota archaeon]|nr:DegT/DnrJ/EryC1/StrS family aminotransferase [Candidatus Brockarchaeota archaeon]
VSSGTAALHAALVAAEVSRGDCVIIPSFTFVAAAEAVLLAGAKPILADIDPETYTVSRDSIEENLSSRTKAVIVTHLYGLPADVGPIKELAQEKGLVLIEDAAQALGAEYEGKKIGSIGDMTCFSFYATKNLTTGEGGMVTTNAAEYAERLRVFRCHGESRRYESSRLGTNYRMSEIQAAIGVAQLSKLSKFLSRRKRNASILTSELAGASGIQLPVEPEGRTHSWNLYTIRVKTGGRHSTKRDKMVKDLRGKGVQAGVYYPLPVHLMPYYREILRIPSGSLPNSELAARTVLSLPVHPRLDDRGMALVADSALKSIEKISR